jgi:hypothetical protein
MREKAIKKLMKFLHETTDCINYPYNSKHGYGDIQLWDNNGKKKHFLTHRLSYELNNNVLLTSEQLVCHTCDNPSCINPLHLFIGTHSDNCKDKVNKNRQAKGKQNGRYIHGHYSLYDYIPKPKTDFSNLFSRKLTRDQVLSIKEELNLLPKLHIKYLSEKYNVSCHIIKDIKYGRTYKNI